MIEWPNLNMPIYYVNESNSSIILCFSGYPQACETYRGKSYSKILVSRTVHYTTVYILLVSSHTI